MIKLRFNRSRIVLCLAVVYLFLLAWSHRVIFEKSSKLSENPKGRQAEIVTIETSKGPVSVAFYRWEPTESGNSKPLLLFHGSPGSALGDFSVLASMLQQAGHPVIAFDRLGYGRSDRWVPDYSTMANAEVGLKLMGELGIEEFHVGGFSYGGACAVHAASQAPERVKSVTLLSALGVQEGEGSGSFVFEHFKYVVGWVGLVALPEMIPHFGILGDRTIRHSLIRDFLDTDQRPIEEEMKELQAPTLIVQGVDDPLVPSWAAVMHDDMIAKSRLLMLDTDHFWIFGSASRRPVLDQVAAEMAGFLDAVEKEPALEMAEQEGMPSEMRQRVKRPLMGGLLKRGALPPWWIWIAVVVSLHWVRALQPALLVVSAMLVAGLYLDFGVAIVAVIGGRLAFPHRGKRVREALATAAAFVILWIVILLIERSVTSLFERTYVFLLVAAILTTILYGVRALRSRRLERQRSTAGAGIEATDDS